MGGINFGWLAVWVPSPDWPRRKIDFSQALRWSRRTWGGECGPCTDLTSYTLALAYNWGKSQKTSVRVAEKRSADQCRTRFVWSTWPSRAMASTGLRAPAALGSRLRRRGQPSVSVSICRVAVQGGSPRQPTLSRSSQSGIWCGRQTAEHPSPRVSACYVPGGTSSKAKTLWLQHL